jgi:hypothetical protein
LSSAKGSTDQFSYNNQQDLQTNVDQSGNKTKKKSKTLHHVIVRIVFMLLGGFIAAIGGVIVALYSDSRVRKREKRVAIESRRLDFIEYMVKWREKNTGFDFVSGGRGSHYMKKRSVFLGRASRIEGDFTDSARYEAFKAARDRLATLTPSDVDEPYDNKGKKLILKAIQDVIDAT